MQMTVNDCGVHTDGRTDSTDNRAAAFTNVARYSVAWPSDKPWTAWPM